MLSASQKRFPCPRDPSPRNHERQLEKKGPKTLIIRKMLKLSHDPMFSRVRVPETASNTPPGRAKTERDKLRTREEKRDFGGVPNCLTVSNCLIRPILPHRLKPSHKSHTASPSQTVSQIPYCLTVSNRLTNPKLPHRLKLSHRSHTVSPSQTVSQIPYCLTVSNRLTNPILPHRLKPSHKSHTASPSQTVSSVPSCPTVSNRLTNPKLPHRLIVSPLRTKSAVR